ncbi:unnamed protein product [Auanema sp. JU1783]|nr:unnamed protein product [Auanema sp. JU1783]
MNSKVLFLLLSIAVATQADWWDDVVSSASSGLSSAGDWLRETAGPAVREKFNDAKSTLQDPETHRNIKEWISEKAEAASEFAQTEVIPELKKIYEAATAEDTTTPSTNNAEKIVPLDGQ